MLDSDLGLDLFLSSRRSGVGVGVSLPLATESLVSLGNRS